MPARGGAYRTGCFFDPGKGELVLYSDRDPDVMRTLEAYLGAGAWLASRDLAREEVERAALLAAAEHHRRPAPMDVCRSALAQSMSRASNDARRALYDEMLAIDPSRGGAAVRATLGAGETRRSFCVLGDPAWVDRVQSSPFGRDLSGTGRLDF